jgi:hypothetical protein
LKEIANMSEATDWLKDVQEVVAKGQDIAPVISTNLLTHLESYETVLEILSRPPEEVTKVMALLGSVTSGQAVSPPPVEVVVPLTPSQEPPQEEPDPLVAQATGIMPAGLGGGGTEGPSPALTNWMANSGVNTGSYDEADMRSSGMQKSGDGGNKSSGLGSPQKLTRIVE